MGKCLITLLYLAPIGLGDLSCHPKEVPIMEPKQARPKGVSKPQRLVIDRMQLVQGSQSGTQTSKNVKKAQRIVNKIKGK